MQGILQPEKPASLGPADGVMCQHATVSGKGQHPNSGLHQMGALKILFHGPKDITY